MTALHASARTRRPSRRLAAAALVAAAILAPQLMPSAASAHDALVSTSPADGETVQTLPDAITLTFSGALLEGAPQAVFVTDASCPGIDEAEPGSIAIDRASCRDYAAGDAAADGPLLTQQLDVAGAPAGEYTVIASVTYGDSHSEDKIFRFTTAEAAPGGASEAPSAEPAETPAAEDTAAPTETSEDAASPLPWILGGIGAVVALSLVAVLVGRARRSS